MTENENPNAAQDDDVEGHRAGPVPGVAGGGPDAPGFTIEIPTAVEEDDDVEGHLSGAVRVDPTVPSALNPDARHPKA